MNALTKWIKTNEDWYPSFAPLKYNNPLEHTALRVHLYGPYPDNKFLVCVWGADDHGMELQGSEEELTFIYDIIDDYITETALKILGLNYC